MAYNHRKLAAKQRQKWMRTYEGRLNELCPFTIGKVCWDTAHYLYTQGMDARAAAEKHSLTLRTTI